MLETHQPLEKENGKDATDATILNENSFNTVATNLHNGRNIFYWTITEGSCASDDSIIVTVFANPDDADAGPDQEIF